MVTARRGDAARPQGHATHAELGFFHVEAMNVMNALQRPGQLGQQWGAQGRRKGAKWCWEWAGSGDGGLLRQGHGRQVLGVEGYLCVGIHAGVCSGYRKQIIVFWASCHTLHRNTT